MFSALKLREFSLCEFGRGDVMAGRENIDILKREGVEGLRDLFLFCPKLWLLLATMCLNGNILFAV